VSEDSPGSAPAEEISPNAVAALEERASAD